MNSLGGTRIAAELSGPLLRTIKKIDWTPSIVSITLYVEVVGDSTARR